MFDIAVYIYIFSVLDLCVHLIEYVRSEKRHQSSDVLWTVSERCALYCVSEGGDGERMYRRLSDRVVDGTPCSRAPNSVCINGTCQVRRCHCVDARRLLLLLLRTFI